MNESDNPWTTLTSTIVYDNEWISVHHETVLTPTGREGIYGKLHFKKVAVGVIPLDEQLNTWLVGQYRYPLNEYSWEIPMGGGDFDVPTQVTAQRELKEETGLLAESWEEIGKIHTSNSVTDEVGFLFIARNLTQADTEFDDTEVLKIRKLPFSEVVEMVMDGRITDSLSVYGILKVARLLNL